MSAVSIFLILLAVLQILDAWTTYIALKRRVGVEANGFLAKIFDKIGFRKGLLLKLIAAAGLIYYLWTTQGQPWVVWVSGLACLFYAALVINNWKIIDDA